MTAKVASYTANSHLRRIRFLVSGDVQGVGFRAFTQGIASGLGLAGWIKNNWDGKVEGEAEGIPSSVQELISLLERGPISAHVDSVVIGDLPVLGEKPPFRIAR